MSMAFVHLKFKHELVMSSAVELSVLTRVAGCGWPILLRIFCSSTPFLALIYNEPSSDSAVEDMMTLMILAMLWMAPLFGEEGTFLDR